MDDLLKFSSNIECINETKYFFIQIFDIENLCLIDVILGVKVIKRDREYILAQFHYIEKLLRKINYFDCKPTKTLKNPNHKSVPNKGTSIN